MAAASPGLPCKNPPFNLPDFPVARLAGLALAEAHMDPEERSRLPRFHLLFYRNMVETQWLQALK